MWNSQNNCPWIFLVLTVFHFSLHYYHLSMCRCVVVASPLVMTTPISRDRTPFSVKDPTQRFWLAEGRRKALTGLWSTAQIVHWDVDLITTCYRVESMAHRRHRLPMYRYCKAFKLMCVSRFNVKKYVTLFN